MVQNGGFHNSLDTVYFLKELLDRENSMPFYSREVSFSGAWLIPRRVGIKISIVYDVFLPAPDIPSAPPPILWQFHSFLNDSQWACHHSGASFLLLASGLLPGFSALCPLSLDGLLKSPNHKHILFNVPLSLLHLW